MSSVANLTQINVALNGAAAPSALMQYLGHIRIVQRVSLPSQCELTFVFPMTIAEQLIDQTPGVTLTLRLHENNALLFDGYLVAIEHEFTGRGTHLVHLRAYDALYHLNQRQPIRSHFQLTCSELAAQLIEDLGLSVDARVDGPVFEQIMQYKQTDFELLADMATRSGLLFSLRGDVLIFHSLTGTHDRVNLSLGKSVLEARVLHSSAQSSRSVEAFAWNPWLAESVSGSASSARHAGSSESSESSFAEQRFITGMAAQSSGLAVALAQENLDARFNHGTSLHAVAKGDPLLRPGVVAHIDGLGLGLETDYVICNVTHTIDREHGYQSTFDNQLDHITGPRVASACTTVGVVTDNDDPQGLARIRVSLPAYSDLETQWLQVSMPGAGADKGLMFLPDVDDKVLVQLLGEDICQAVIIGNLYAQQKSPECNIKNGRSQVHTIKSSVGQQIKLDDSKNALSLETAKGSDLSLMPGNAKLRNSNGCYVQLKGDTVVVHATKNLELEAPGGQITLRGKAIDFEQR